jgi:hypothetical protein
VKKAAALAAIATCLIAGMAAPASADKWCEVNEYRTDDRSASGRLPRQGVIEFTVWSFDYITYQPRSIEDDGSIGYIHLNAHDSKTPLVSAWESPEDCYGFGRAGAWAVTPWGQVFTDGDNGGHYGDMNQRPLNKPIEGMAITSNGEGYWLFAGDGGIFTFGNAAFLGSTGGMGIPAPIVAMAATPSGRGYWMTGADGSQYVFGDAKRYGDMRGTRLNRPVVGMVPTPTGRGYWMVAADGGIFTFGDAVFKGSTANYNLAWPIVGMTPYRAGYTLMDQAGNIYPFG